MTAILHVTPDIRQVHEQRRHPVTNRFIDVADLGGNDRLHGRRQR